jgi:hypothetical protein
MMNKYSYNGPVMEFDRCIANKWRGETMAVSEKKAKSNLVYQFKKKNNRTATTRISLPGNVELVEIGA